MVKRRLVLVAVLIGFTVMVTGCGEGGTETEDTANRETVMGDGEIRLVARWTGAHPSVQPMDLSGYEECGVDSANPRKTVINENGTLRNVAFIVQSGPQGIWRERTNTEEIVQEHCAFHPRVITVQTGQTLQVVDRDPGLHNIRGTRDGRQLFNHSTYQNQAITVSFDRSGRFELSCDVHPWMRSIVMVTNHGQADVTNIKGEAVLRNLPPGRYELQTWHEEYGFSVHTVNLSKGETRTLEVQFPSHTLIQ